MGKTIMEKILARAAGRSEVSVGEYIWVSPKRPVVLPWSFNRGPNQFEALGATRVYDPKLVKIIQGHHGVTASHGMAEAGAKVRQWCQKVGIPDSNILDLGRQGIEHVLSGELAWALPGEVFVEVVNGHTSIQGALGCFAFPLAFESGAFLVTGKTWIRVPESVKFNITGRLQKGVTARDVFEYVLGQVGGAGATAQVMEWTGPVIDRMGMDGRFTLCCGAIFTGAWTAIVNPDEKTIAYVKARTDEPFEVIKSDPDATYAKTYEFNVSKIEPQVVPPPKRENAQPVSELLGVKVNKGFIGSCFNGRIEDMRMAARILKSRKVHPKVVLNITPATMGIYRQCLREGLIDIFADAEATVPPPACGMCVGANTPLGAGDVCVATNTSNFPGRMGSREADIYLASPATAAASAIEGRIADPRNYL